MTRHCITFKLAAPHCGTMFGNCPFVLAITEYLRYGGAVGIKGIGHTDFVPHEVEDDLAPTRAGEECLLTVDCPPDLIVLDWAQQNLDRLASFLVRAVYWVENKTGYHVRARNFGPQPKKVRIEVRGGVAEVTAKPPDVEVEIIDHDVEEVESDVEISDG